jgi:hypothetical protein
MNITGIIWKGLLILLVFIWGANALNTHRVRYRITVDVETPNGVRSGSGMVQVTTWNSVFVPNISRYSSEEYVKGEAAFVDLGGGKQIIALLANGPNAQNSDWTRYVRQAFGMKDVEDSWNVLSRTRASMELPRDWQPTLVTFSDITNPASAKVLRAINYRQECADPGWKMPNCQPKDIPMPFDNIAATFGAGYALRSIRMSYVDPGLRLTHIWPINQLPLTWPHWLFGEPLTTGIEGKLPLLVMHREKLRRISDDLPPRFQPHFHYFLREGF